MPSQQSLWLITYDIAKPKRWRQVFRLLKSYGSTIQLSVFECRLTSAQHAKLWRALAQLIDEQEDRLHAYLVCGHCDKQVYLLGNACRPEKQPVVWVVSDEP